jgi:hypothetical protein
VSEIWIDDEGNELSDEEAQWLLETGGYVDTTDYGPRHPDATDQWNLRDRDLWPSDQTERAQAREAYFKARLDYLKENS